MNNNIKGVLAMLASATGFVLNDALIKFMTSELPNGQIIFLRGLVATSIMGLITSITGGWRRPSALLKPAMVVRTLAAVAATLMIVATLRHLPLATTNAILQVSPLIVTAGAAIFLGAHVGWRRWMLSLIGFFGVMLIVKPGTASFVPAAALALVCLAATSTRDLLTRFIDHSVPSILVTFATAAAVTLSGLALIPFETWVMPSPNALILLLLTSVCHVVAYHFGIVAMRTGEIPIVAPFRYFAIVLALTLGYVVWNDIPDVLSTIGIALIVSAGLAFLTIERSAAKARARTRQAAMQPAPAAT